MKDLSKNRLAFRIAAAAVTISVCLTAIFCAFSAAACMREGGAVAAAACTEAVLQADAPAEEADALAEEKQRAKDAVCAAAEQAAVGADTALQRELQDIVGRYTEDNPLNAYDGIIDAQTSVAAVAIERERALAEIRLEQTGAALVALLDPEADDYRSLKRALESKVDAAVADILAAEDAAAIADLLDTLLAVLNGDETVIDAALDRFEREHAAILGKETAAGEDRAAIDAALSDLAADYGVAVQESARADALRDSLLSLKKQALAALLRAGATGDAAVDAAIEAHVARLASVGTAGGREADAAASAALDELFVWAQAEVGLQMYRAQAKASYAAAYEAAYETAADPAADADVAAIYASIEEAPDLAGVNAALAAGARELIDGLYAGQSAEALSLAATYKAEVAAVAEGAAAGGTVADVAGAVRRVSAALEVQICCESALARAAAAGVADTSSIAAACEEALAAIESGAGESAQALAEAGALGIEKALAKAEIAAAAGEAPGRAVQDVVDRYTEDSPLDAYDGIVDAQASAAAVALERARALAEIALQRAGEQLRQLLGESYEAARVGPNGESIDAFIRAAAAGVQGAASAADIAAIEGDALGVLRSADAVVEGILASFEREHASILYKEEVSAGDLAAIDGALSDLAANYGEGVQGSAQADALRGGLLEQKKRALSALLGAQLGENAAVDGVIGAYIARIEAVGTEGGAAEDAKASADLDALLLQAQAEVSLQRYREQAKAAYAAAYAAAFGAQPSDEGAYAAIQSATDLAGVNAALAAGACELIDGLYAGASDEALAVAAAYKAELAAAAEGATAGGTVAEAAGAVRRASAALAVQLCCEDALARAAAAGIGDTSSVEAAGAQALAAIESAAGEDVQALSEAGALAIEKALAAAQVSHAAAQISGGAAQDILGEALAAIEGAESGAEAALLAEKGAAALALEGGRAAWLAALDEADPRYAEKREAVGAAVDAGIEAIGAARTAEEAERAKAEAVAAAEGASAAVDRAQFAEDHASILQKEEEKIAVGDLAAIDSALSDLAEHYGAEAQETLGDLRDALLERKRRAVLEGLGALQAQAGGETAGVIEAIVGQAAAADVRGDAAEDAAVSGRLDALLREAEAAVGKASAFEAYRQSVAARLNGLRTAADPAEIAARIDGALEELEGVAYDPDGSLAAQQAALEAIFADADGDVLELARAEALGRLEGAVSAADSEAVRAIAAEAMAAVAAARSRSEAEKLAAEAELAIEEQRAREAAARAESFEACRQDIAARLEGLRTAEDSAEVTARIDGALAQLQGVAYDPALALDAQRDALYALCAGWEEAVRGQWRAEAKADLDALLTAEDGAALREIVREAAAAIDGCGTREQIAAAVEDAKGELGAERLLAAHDLAGKSLADIAAEDGPRIEAALEGARAQDAAVLGKLNERAQAQGYAPADGAAFEAMLADFAAKSAFEGERQALAESLAAAEGGERVQAAVQGALVALERGFTYPQHADGQGVGEDLDALCAAMRAEAEAQRGAIAHALRCEEAEERIRAAVQEKIAGGCHNAEQESRLEELLAEAAAAIDGVAAGEDAAARLGEIVQAFLGAADAVPVVTVTAEGSGGIAGSVTADKSLPGGTRLVIAGAEGDAVQAAERAAEGGKLYIAADAGLTQAELLAFVRGSGAQAAFDVRLENAAGAEAGGYTVALRLPESLLQAGELRVLAADEDGNVTLLGARVGQDGYVTFHTDRLARFYVLGEGDSAQQSIPYGAIAGIAAGVTAAAAGCVLAVLWLRSRKKK